MKDRRRVDAGTRWGDVVGYARAVRVGSVIEVSGTTAVDESGSVVGAGDPAAQTTFILRKIGLALEALGSSLGDVVRTRMYVTDISQWEEIGRAHGEVFSSILPTTSMVEVAALIDPQLLIEIEATAITDGE